MVGKGHLTGGPPDSFERGYDRGLQPQGKPMQKTGQKKLSKNLQGGGSNNFVQSHVDLQPTHTFSSTAGNNMMDHHQSHQALLNQTNNENFWKIQMNAKANEGGFTDHSGAHYSKAQPKGAKLKGGKSAHLADTNSRRKILS
mmetsp:Transcript_29801/g.45442  ORF Transcript_29801/g.45442 Transcript_29801/m.45442 type:complete len:142 (-) Transcript_29801:8018-8443(-)